MEKLFYIFTSCVFIDFKSSIQVVSVDGSIIVIIFEEEKLVESSLIANEKSEESEGEASIVESHSQNNGIDRFIIITNSNNDGDEEKRVVFICRVRLRLRLRQDDSIRC